MLTTVSNDMNLEERLRDGPNQIPSTAKGYNVYLKKFAAFVEAGDSMANGEMLAKEYFTDENIAKFLIALRDEYDSKPHVLKAACASIGHRLKVNLLQNLFDFKHLYGKTHNAIQVKHYQPSAVL